MSAPEFTERRVSPAGRDQGGAAAADPAGKPDSSPEAPGKKPGDDGNPTEIGGPPGPDPTRYGDWELKGRCIDF